MRKYEVWPGNQEPRDDGKKDAEPVIFKRDNLHPSIIHKNSTKKPGKPGFFGKFFAVVD